MDIRTTTCPSRQGGVRGSTIKKSREAVKRLDRLAPTLVHVCGLAKYNPPLNTPGAFGGGGFRGSQIQNSGEAVKRLDRLAQNLARMWRFIWEWIYTKQIAPRDTGGGGTWGGFRGSQIQKSWEAVTRLDRFAPKLVHVCGFVWEWT